MREVLGFSAREVAEHLDTTVAAVNSSLQRARAVLAKALPDRTQQATRHALGDARLRELVERYIVAWGQRDVEALVAILAEDVTFAMPPHPHWWSGREDVIAFVVSTGCRTRASPAPRPTGSPPSPGTSAKRPVSPTRAVDRGALLRR